MIINVTSTVTMMPFALLAVYTASKAAVNAYTECLALELAPFGISARLVLPGRSPTTQFGANARERMEGTIPDAYSVLAQSLFAAMGQPGLVTEAREVAEAIWRAATDPATPMRSPAGADAVALAAAS